ncbi:Kelch-like protein 12 [Durusdinium trenchii]|uniref:Kelch-like protein 12 n=1 Tax=Durusdinium trenchii TaxID=1381693 RepID=A0ABP0Q722_9DINO
MPSPRRLCAATACNGSLYVFGGEAVNLIPGIPNSVNNLDGMIRYFWPTDGQDYMQLDSAERFDPMHGTWEVLPRMPTSRAGCAATTADGLIYVSGGRLGETVLSVFERYDPHIGRWEVLPRVPTARSGCSSVSVKGGIYVLGGKCSNGRVQGVCERFHPTFGRWEKLQPMLSPRSAFAAGVLMEVIYAAGGFNGAVGLSSAARRGLGLTGLLGRLKAREGELAGVGEVECFDPATGFWSETVAMNTPRVGGAAAVTGGAVTGGGSSAPDILGTQGALHIPCESKTSFKNG